jgi:hypothetical protein
MDSYKSSLENTIIQSDETNDIPKLTRNQRYHYLNREKRNTKALEKYHNNPEVIAKREAREKAKTEREAEKKAKKEQEIIEKNKLKQLLIEERIKLATETKKSQKSKNKNIFDSPTSV